MKGSPNPNAAKAFAEFMLSDDGAEAVPGGRQLSPPVRTCRAPEGNPVARQKSDIMGLDNEYIEKEDAPDQEAFKKSCNEARLPRRTDMSGLHMKTRKLGQLDVSAIGLGCMTMTPIYGEPDEAEAIATIHRAVELGVTLIDTSDAYDAGAQRGAGRPRAEGPARQVHRSRRKFGNIRRPDGSTAASNGQPEYVRRRARRA